jgi:hypothetical protein
MTKNSSHAITFKMAKLIAPKTSYCGEDFVLVRDGKLYIYQLASMDDKELAYRCGMVERAYNLYF